jgi:hypothetical protein
MRRWQELKPASGFILTMPLIILFMSIAIVLLFLNNDDVHA